MIKVSQVRPGVMERSIVSNSEILGTHGARELDK